MSPSRRSIRRNDGPPVALRCRSAQAIASPSLGHSASSNGSCELVEQAVERMGLGLRLGHTAHSRTRGAICVPRTGRKTRNNRLDTPRISRFLPRFRTWLGESGSSAVGSVAAAGRVRPRPRVRPLGSGSFGLGRSGSASGSGRGPSSSESVAGPPRTRPRTRPRTPRRRAPGRRRGAPRCRPRSHDRDGGGRPRRSRSRARMNSTIEVQTLRRRPSTCWYSTLSIRSVSIQPRPAV